MLGLVLVAVWSMYSSGVSSGAYIGSYGPAYPQKGQISRMAKLAPVRVLSKRVGFVHLGHRFPLSILLFLR